MKELMALRIYLALSARITPTRFWHHLTAPALSHHLLAAAHRAGIYQALLTQVQAGYLPNKKMSNLNAEGSLAHHPLCIELLDTEERLRKFLQDHAHELKHVEVVLFKCELPLAL